MILYVDWANFISFLTLYVNFDIKTFFIYSVTFLDALPGKLSGASNQDLFNPTRYVGFYNFMIILYTNSLVDATFGSGKKSCYPKIVLTKLKLNFA